MDLWSLINVFDGPNMTLDAWAALNRIVDTKNPVGETEENLNLIQEYLAHLDYCLDGVSVIRIRREADYFNMLVLNYLGETYGGVPPELMGRSRRVLTGEEALTDEEGR